MDMYNMVHDQVFDGFVDLVMDLIVHVHIFVESAKGHEAHRTCPILPRVNDLDWYNKVQIRFFDFLVFAKELKQALLVSYLSMITWLG